MNVKNDNPLEYVVEQIEQHDFQLALSLIDDFPASQHLNLYQHGCLSALRWYCMYSLDDDIEADSITDILSEETRTDYLAGFATQLAQIDALHLAEPAFERWINVAPADAVAWHSYGLTLLKQEYWKDAEKALVLARKFDPSIISTHYLLGHCYNELDEPEKAAASYEAYLTLQPDDLDALILGGIAYSNAGQFDKAGTFLNRARTTDQQNVSALYNLAIIASRTDDTKQLNLIKEQVSKLTSDDPQIPLTMYVIHQYRGEIDEAWHCVEEAFSGAAETENWPIQDVAVAEALNLASKHDQTTKLESWINIAFEHHCFSEGILQSVRQHSQPCLKNAKMFSITVEGRIPKGEAFETDSDANPNEPIGYYWSMAVCAENQEKACNIAMDFDRRCGREPIDAEIHEAVDELSNTYQGVCWCQRELMTFPLADLED